MKRLLLLAMLAACAAWAKPIRFATMDVVVELGSKQLAAYQVELTAGKDTYIVGLEGAGQGPFADAPWYDAAGIGSDHIVIAAFSTKREGLPTGTTRIARIHLQLSGDAPRLKARLVTAAGPDGKKLEFEIALKPVQKESADE